MTEHALLITDIKNYLAGKGDGVAAAVLLQRCLAALEGNACAEIPEPPPDPQSLRLGTQVYVECPITSGNKVLGRIEHHDPSGEFPYWVVVNKGNRGVWRAAHELEIV
jgi:hypothetical protein